MEYSIRQPVGKELERELGRRTTRIHSRVIKMKGTRQLNHILGYTVLKFRVNQRNVDVYR